MHPRAAELITTLGLQPHPEGGFYRQIFRSVVQVNPMDRRGPRAALTTIYFLLPEGTFSRWHQVASDEVWHLYEGGPLAVVEAMAASVAVVATEVGGIGELVRPGVTGAVAAKGEPDALGLALLDVLADPERAAALGAEGRRFAQQELSLERMVGRLVGLYDELAA